MSTFEINLPDYLAEFVIAQAKTAGFSNTNDFLVSLVSKLQTRQTEIENALMDGINSGPVTDWDSREIDAIKNRLGESRNP